VVLGSQRVIPNAAQSAGFRYSFAGVDEALHAILRTR
jgi:NAD dependent epimerase/dehydratase family enzyme